METMKKEWGKPLTGVQEFIPQEFIAACAPDVTYITYTFKCDASANQLLDSYRVYRDNPPYLEEVAEGWAHTSGDTYLGLYHPCNETHTITVVKDGTEQQTFEREFPRGLMETRKILFWNNETHPVRLWTDHDTNIHCTFKLNNFEYTEHTPS